MAPVRPGFLVPPGMAMEHSNGVCGQHVTNCLEATWTHCVPGVGAVSIAHRGSEYASATLDWVEKTGRTVDLVLVVPT